MTVPREAAGTAWSVLAGTSRPLAAMFDVALMDLDGVVNRGERAVPHAAAAIEAAGRQGMRTVYVTNNALRTPETVAARLTGFGVPAEPSEVVTSAQAAAHVLAERLPAGAVVLVAGGVGLREAVRAEGLVPTGSAADEPAAVVQGFDPEINYARLAEAVLAIRAGAWWVASNTDLTVPTERGLAPGNGALVAFVRAATGAEPEVTGKPEFAMHAESVRRSGARDPIIVGDRLDTDIEAGFRAGTPTLLVFTGVTGPAELLGAPARHRPTFLAADLRGLLRPQPAALARDGSSRCGGWTCDLDGGTLRWHQADPGSADPGSDGPDDGLDALRAACALVWAAADEGRPVEALATDRPPGCEDLRAPAAR
ncbi:HAD-IIA family hydrolase [Frankia sp. Mgl5]|uniref:HAD-IIA family hydrolase n=1 Tax=Frankia sp. Mgl5 TaxID=2933793 RepID=UPI00200E7018|nr:HAD-IIA family hydrolase [Frankia sp. Mgl5]MCK9930661.1 HAD-IIA family hydrolase [Frankia sp. Mgl5]